MLQESGEMYLETIHILHQKKGAVRSVDVADHMGFSRPSVSRGIGLLKKEGFITVDKNGYISLTKQGKRTAEKIYERHILLAKFLVRLGVDEITAAKDACKIEHHISDISFQAIKNHVAKYTKETVSV